MIICFHHYHAQVCVARSCTALVGLPLVTICSDKKLITGHGDVHHLRTPSCVSEQHENMLALFVGVSGASDVACPTLKVQIREARLCPWGTIHLLPLYFAPYVVRRPQMTNIPVRF